MRTEALNHKYVYDSPLQVSHLVEAVANSTRACLCDASKNIVELPVGYVCRLSVLSEHHKCTQFYVRRPYGVGLLVAGYDVRCGVALFTTCVAC
jgi:20S proteasome subunit alpha 6